MRNRGLKLVLAVLFVSCAFGVVLLRMAWATPATGVTRTLLVGPVVFDEIDARSHTQEHSALVKTRGLSDVYIMDIKIAPGGDTGWHSHPGVVFAAVKSGAATEYDGDDPDAAPVVHDAGTGWTEEAGHVHLVRNEGETDLELVVLFLVPHGAPTRIDEPAPGDDPK